MSGSILHVAGPRGYVPSAMLVHYHQVSKDSPLSPHIATVISRPDGRRHSYTPLAQPAISATTPYFQVSSGGGSRPSGGCDFSDIPET